MGREGFLHPYEISGGVAEVKLQVLLRDFETAGLADWAEMLRAAAAATMAEFPGSTIDVAITPSIATWPKDLPGSPGR